MFCYPFPLLFSGERKKKRSGGRRRKEAPFPFIFTPSSSSSSSRYCATLQIPEINRALLFAEGKYRRGFFIFGDVLYVLGMRHKIAPKKNSPFSCVFFSARRL